MINRTYVVKMPESASGTTPLDILVESAPGTQAAPITFGTGLYYEVRGRTLRFEQRKLTSAGNANSAWSPRARLGFSLTVTPFGNAALQTDAPDTFLSASFGTFAATGMVLPAVAVPDSVSGGPLIRLVGGASTADKFYLVTLLIAEDKDEDRSPSGGR
jgi:hypothetical protein